jgi:hypothetical protein
MNMSILGKNAPAFDYRIVGLRHPSGAVEVRLQVHLVSGDLYTLDRWQSTQGRLDDGQLKDIVSQVGAEISDAILTNWGIQTVLR